MEVILLERVDKLGQMGDIVTVKPGFARNFLLPKKKALRATEENKKQFESQKKEIEARNLEARKEAEAVAKKMDGKQCVLLRQAGESGQLYGSVTSRDIAATLAEAGFSVERNQVILDRAIKALGLHDIVIRLHPEVTVTVKINVARSSEEAEQQLETGKAVVAEDIFETRELAEAAAEELSEAPAEEEEAAEGEEDGEDDETSSGNTAESNDETKVPEDDKS